MGSIPDGASFFFIPPFFSLLFFSPFFSLSPFFFFSPSFILLPFFLSPPLFPSPFYSPLYARSAISMLKHFSSYFDTKDTVQTMAYADGPDVVQGPAERAVRLGDPVMLLCGTDLDSNPQATVRWTSPAGQPITNNDRYDLTQNNAGTVRLDFTNATIGDRGIWVCNITVSAMQVSQPNSDMLLSETTVGTFISEITLHLVGQYVHISTKEACTCVCAKV